MATLQGYRRFGGIAFRAGPALSITTALAALAGTVAPLASAAAVGAVVGRIPSVIATGLDSPDGRAAVAWAIVAGALFLVQSGALAAETAAATALGDRVDLMLQRDLMAAVMAPTDIAHLEDHDTLNLINVGRETFRAWLKPGKLATSLSRFARGRFTLVGGCLIVARFRWPVAVLLLAAGIWAEYEDKVASRQEATHHYGGTEVARRTEYYYDLGVTPPAAKEVRIFGLPRFLLARYSDSWNRSMENVLVKAGPRPLLSASALAAVAVATFVWVWVDANAARFGIGPATVYAQAILVSLGGVRNASWASLQIELALATLRRYQEAMAAIRPLGGAVAAGRPADGLPADEIRFEAVHFRYPDGQHDILDGLDLTVPAGRSLAIVGANGAGKTTLVKLLCRLNQPTDGRITVDGAALEDLDPMSWRRRIAAVFQDSVHYELPAATNVGFGHVPAMDDREALEAAAEDAGLATAVATLPHGWDTVLSPNYANGSDLSGGEWQKVGLARALFAVRHGASILIMDEPAAHLDARAEAQLYERFLAITAGVTTVVISHRFSTVRQADSIAVLRDGKVIEHGSHDELMALGGHYAEMFRLQAARFSDAVGPARSAGRGDRGAWPQAIGRSEAEAAPQ